MTTEHILQTEMEADIASIIAEQENDPAALRMERDWLQKAAKWAKGYEAAQMRDSIGYLNQRIATLEIHACLIDGYRKQFAGNLEGLKRTRRITGYLLADGDHGYYRETALKDDLYAMDLVIAEMEAAHA